MNINDYIFINRVALKLLGLYPINIVRYFICIGCIILIVIPQIVQIYQDWGTLTTVLEISSVLFTMMLCILKSLVWIFNRQRVVPFIDFMISDYWKMVHTSDSRHLDIYATYAKKITKGYLFLIYNCLLFFFSLPIIDIFVTIIKGTTNNGTNSFPFVATYPITFYKFPYYEIVYISQMISSSLCGLLVLGVDTFIATALFHTCGHFKILQENLKQLDRDICHINSLGNNSKDKSMSIGKLKLQIADIVRHHQLVLWFCDNMEQNFNPMLLLQTLASSCIICLVGLQVSTTLTDKSKLLKYFSYLPMTLFQLLMFCFPGDVLIDQSSNMSEAVYSIQWYNLPLPLKTEVYLLILRSQKPSYISAGKLYIMNFENFSAVLSTAISYFMMLRSVSSEGKEEKLDL